MREEKEKEDQQECRELEKDESKRRKKEGNCEIERQSKLAEGRWRKRREKGKKMVSDGET